jgi:hypothetical protein
MRKPEEMADPSSCLNKASDEEILFVLRSKDPAMVPAIRAWIAERIRLGKNQRTDAKIVEAEMCIETILAEQRAAGLLPPLPEPKFMCNCERCGKTLTTGSTGNFELLGDGTWKGVCYACLDPEED